MKNKIDPEKRSLTLEEDILSSDRFHKAWNIRHHYSTSVAVHSERTAEYAMRICSWLKRHSVRINEEDVMRACLLHDIGMTDDKVSHSISFRKAYLHPVRSEQIAKDEFHANAVQCNAIRRHMWPICVIPPRYKEGWIVIAADKLCSLREVFRRRKPDGVC